MTERMQDRALECQSIGAPEVGEGLKTVLLAPDGVVESTNGRFIVDAEGAAMMVESFERQGVQLVVDFEHQTLGGAYSAPDGRAPAAGWVTRVFYEVGRGVSALVKWNPKTREAIREGAYGYVSPVLIVRKSDLKAIGLHSVALTNKPAIVGLERIAASQNANGVTAEVSVHPIIHELAGLIGMPVKSDTTGTAVLAACRDRLKVLAADDSAAIAASVRERLGLPATADKDAITLGLAVRASGGAADAELAAMRESEARREATAMVQLYIGAGKLNPNDKPAVEAATRLAMSDPGTLEAIFKNMVPQCPPGRTNPPTSRQMKIVCAEREFRSNPAHGRSTSLQAFVANSLREGGFSKLTDAETSELSIV